MLILERSNGVCVESIVWRVFNEVSIKVYVLDYVCGRRFGVWIESQAGLKMKAQSQQLVNKHTEQYARTQNMNLYSLAHLSNRFAY